MTRAARLAAAVLAGLVLLAFRSVGGAYYGGFVIPQGVGMLALLPQEIVHYALFFVFGLMAALLLAVALAGTSVPAAGLRALRALGERPWTAAAGVSAGMAAAALAVGLAFLGDGVLTDDEHVYRFIAQTLRTGSLTAPSPGTDLAFFGEQFVVITEKVRYGKYPIGFPLVLAAGQALHAERLVVPLLTGALGLLIAWVGLKELPSRVVVLALLLFAISPQVLLTGPTLLSQPLSAVCLMAALGCLLELGRRGARAARWAAGAGALLGFGVLVRPLPGVLFTAVAVTALAAGPRWGMRRRAERSEWAALLAPLAAAAGLLLWVNYRQSGNPFHSGYHAIHPDFGPTLLFHGTSAMYAMSVVSSLVRLNFWLFGWPVSLFAAVFARRSLLTRMIWGMAAAEMLYRVLSPKAGVGHVGAVYFYEIVPPLCLLSADGLARLAARAREARPALLRPETTAAILIALTVVSLTLFLPFKVADLSRAARAQQDVFRRLRAGDVHNAVVFHRGIVALGDCWAYFPPPNSPTLDDDVLFALLPPGPDGMLRAADFWKRRYPARSAWVYGFAQANRPFLAPLSSFVAASLPSPTSAPAARPGT